MTDLLSLVSSAIHLHDEERDIDRWEPEATRIEARVADASPREVGTLCRRLAILQIDADTTFRLSCHAHAAIRDRRDVPAIPGAAEMMRTQAADAERLGDRLLDLRSRLRRLHDAMGARLHALRDQDVDDRLLRLAGDGEAVHCLDALRSMVRDDHGAIADAIGDWRTMHTRGPVLLISGSTTDAEIGEALRRLEATGGAVRSRSLIAGSRWTLRRDATRKAA